MICLDNEKKNQNVWHTRMCTYPQHDNMARQKFSTYLHVEFDFDVWLEIEFVVLIVILNCEKHTQKNDVEFRDKSNQMYYN